MAATNKYLAQSNKYPTLHSLGVNAGTGVNAGKGVLGEPRFQRRPDTTIGIMGPRLILSVLRRRFNAAIRRGTPDTIDLLVVCSEAGMGLESALERVAGEMNRSS